MSFLKLDRFFVRVDRIVALEDGGNFFIVHVDLAKQPTVSVKKQSPEAIALLAAIDVTA